ncbi:MAG: 4Fe-4S binding protein [Nanoarchaeota archaeon]|nr:4Fe-4S binding protein [Nanoarchaeota archaeon]
MRRKIIEVDEKRCNGCGACIPDCPEGALQIIDGKVRLVSELYCDGLGACVGSCPQDAIKVVEKEAKPYDETKVMERIAKQGTNVIKAHLEHLKVHGEKKYLSQAVDYLKKKGIKNPLEEKVDEKPLPCGCPGSQVRDMRGKKPVGYINDAEQESALGQWPVQLKLVPVNAPYFHNSDLLITADCVPFAYAGFHNKFLKDKAVVIGCPKLDDIGFYKEKLEEIIRSNKIKSVSIVHMEVPCCYGLYQAVEEAIKDSGKKLPFKEYVITVDGKIKS